LKEEGIGKEKTIEILWQKLLEPEPGLQLELFKRVVNKSKM